MSCNEEPASAAPTTLSPVVVLLRERQNRGDAAVAAANVGAVDAAVVVDTSLNGPLLVASSCRELSAKISLIGAAVVSSRPMLGYGYSW